MNKPLTTIILLTLITLSGCTDETFLIIRNNTGNGYTQSFTNTDLTDNNITITHNLDSNALEFHVYDENNQAINPDYIIQQDNNNTTLVLESFTPISETWNLIILKRALKTYNTSFTNADLSAGNLTINHGLDSEDVGIQIFNDSNQIMTPNYITTVDINTVNINLANTTVNNTWSAVALSTQPTLDYIQTFSNADLDSNNLTITHNLGTRNIGAYVYDSNNNSIYPSSVIATTDSRATLNFTGFVPLTGTWYVDVFSIGGVANG